MKYPEGLHGNKKKNSKSCLPMPLPLLNRLEIGQIRCCLTSCTELLLKLVSEFKQNFIPKDPDLICKGELRVEEQKSGGRTEGKKTEFGFGKDIYTNDYKIKVATGKHWWCLWV